jgi:phage terminase large subunit GpA-like protein
VNAYAGALRGVAATLAEAIRPQPPVPFGRWLGENIVLVDGPRKGELWSAADAPYLLEIAACLSQEHPSNLVTVRKGQQTGCSILALAWALYIAEVCPDNILYAVPGIDALQDINGQKLQPLIDEWQKKTRKRIIVPVTSRSGTGSTTYEKRFAGGSINLANANSVMDLSMKTSRYGVKDEVSKWSETPNGDDPEALFFGRFTAFRRQKSYKILEISTPELDSGDELGEGPGHCRVDRSFRRSDQRFFHIRCSGCDEEIVQSMDGFHIDREHPHKSFYACTSCGHVIDEAERVVLVRQGRFIPTLVGPDRHPGFHVDAFISLMMSYEAIAEDALAADAKGEAGAKNFANLVLALPYAMRGNAPDHQRLMERRENYPQGIVPPDGLIFVAGADIQHDGIFVEAVAFSADRQTWTVDAEFLPGTTDNPNEGAWPLLEAFRARKFSDAFGGEREIEAMAVDSGDGGRTTQVYEWCRQRSRAYAIKGRHGRGVPAIGTAQRVTIDRRGKLKKYGSATVWPVGTWGLKSEFYGNLHRKGLVAGEAKDPPGYCHFGTWQQEDYFKQITAEYFDQKLVKGRLIEEWKRIRKDNHYLDCRIYAMAMAEHMGLSRLTADAWARLRARLQPAPQTDLLSTASVLAEASETQPPILPAPPVPVSRPVIAKPAPAKRSRANWNSYRK